MDPPQLWPESGHPTGYLSAQAPHSLAALGGPRTLGTHFGLQTRGTSESAPLFRVTIRQARQMLRSAECDKKQCSGMGLGLPSWCYANLASIQATRSNGGDMATCGRNNRSWKLPQSLPSFS